MIGLGSGLFFLLCQAGLLAFLFACFVFGLSAPRFEWCNFLITDFFLCGYFRLWDAVLKSFRAKCAAYAQHDASFRPSFDQQNPLSRISSPEQPL